MISAKRSCLDGGTLEGGGGSLRGRLSHSVSHVVTWKSTTPRATIPYTTATRGSQEAISRGSRASTISIAAFPRVHGAHSSRAVSMTSRTGVRLRPERAGETGTSTRIAATLASRGSHRAGRSRERRRQRRSPETWAKALGMTQAPGCSVGWGGPFMHGALSRTDAAKAFLHAAAWRTFSK